MVRRKNSLLYWSGKPILTIALAAERYGVAPDAMRKALQRAPLKAVEPIDPPPLGERTPAWWQKDLDPAWDARPGQGANLRRSAGSAPTAKRP